MGGGMWNKVQRYGDCPSHMSAWSKQQLGWVKPTLISDEAESVTIAPASTQADVYQLFPSGQENGQEYFLVENRQRTGFDAGLPGSGLAVWHIDETIGLSQNNVNSMECAPSLDCSSEHYLVSLLQADGNWDLEQGNNRGDDGDLFPGRYHNTTLNRFSAPDSRLYDGSTSQVSITEITESQSSITANLTYAYTIMPVANIGGSISPGNSAAIQPGDTITYMMSPKYGYFLNDVVIDGQSVGAVTEYTFSNVQSDHEIYAEFTAEPWMTPTTDNGGDGGGSSGGGGCFIGSMF
jgi:hypothetical protein